MRKLLVKQTEVNCSGWLRISIFKQQTDGETLVTEEPHYLTLGPFDDVGAVIAANSAHLESMGYPPINMAELALPLALRDVCLADQHVKASMESQRIASLAQMQREKDDEARRIAMETVSREAEERRFQEAVSAAVAAELRKHP